MNEPIFPYELPSFADRVRGNSYVGRGIVLGLSADGQSAVSAYFIMGRSENSRNRVFTEKDGDVFTEPFDASKVGDPSLIIYAAVRSHGSDLVVTNGDQTDTVCDYLAKGKTFTDALMTRCFEPDAPNFTPRVSGIVHFAPEGMHYEMSILKSADSDGSACNRQFFRYAPIAGTGHFLHTYVCNGTPIPSFVGEPERIAIPDDIDAFSEEIWNALDEQNRISLYVRYTRLADGAVSSLIVNKNTNLED